MIHGSKTHQAEKTHRHCEIYDPGLVDDEGIWAPTKRAFFSVGTKRVASGRQSGVCGLESFSESGRSRPETLQLGLDRINEYVDQPDTISPVTFVGMRRQRILL